MLVMMEMGSGGWRSRILGGLRHVGRHCWLFSAGLAGRPELRGLVPAYGLPHHQYLHDLLLTSSPRKFSSNTILGHDPDWPIVARFSESCCSIETRTFIWDKALAELYAKAQSLGKRDLTLA